MNIGKAIRIFWIICVIALIIAGCAGQEEVSSIDALMDLGEKYLLDLDYQQALVQFLKVIELDPKNPDAYLGAAEAYQGLGRREEAVEILDTGFAETGDPQIAQRLEELLEEPGETPPEEESEMDEGAPDADPDSGQPLIEGPAPFEDELRQAHLADDSRAMALIAADRQVVDFLLDQVEDPEPDVLYEYAFEVGNGQWILVRGHYEDWKSYENHYYSAEIYVLESLEEQLYYRHARGQIINIDTEITATYEETSFPRPMNRGEHPDLVWDGAYHEELFNFTANESRTYDVGYVDGLRHGEALQVFFRDGQETSRLVTQYDRGEVLPSP